MSWLKATALEAIICLLAACTGFEGDSGDYSGNAVPLTPLPATVAAAYTPTPTLPPTSTHTPTAVPSSTPAPSPTPVGCGPAPPDDYTRIDGNGWTLSQRTVSMLAYAQTLYGGPNTLLSSITQGSYTKGEDASFGTHDGGGAVDLSVKNQEIEGTLLTQEQIDDLIRSLRLAGFAAWLRETDDLYPGSPLHIHAIAVGDAELSEAALEQLTGESGYFLGGNGLPGERAGPDRHGGPTVCPWMLELGYEVPNRE